MRDAIKKFSHCTKVYTNQDRTIQSVTVAVIEINSMGSIKGFKNKIWLKMIPSTKNKIFFHTANML